MAAASLPMASRLMEQIGARVRAIRDQQRRTIKELADVSGVSVGHISMLERGKGNPSFNTLVQIAHALDVPLARLLHTSETTSPVVRSDARRRLDLHNNSTGALHELLTPSLKHSLEAVWVQEPPGYNSESTPFQHAGEEFGLILEGQHTVWLDGIPYDLEPGDSITYASTIPHWYSNRGTTTVKAVWVITPPTF
ncbi:MAG TPA: cupin domain-containing protein [Nakamurella sp.]|nr:cupin domain-containing protein [Nakamurella sp.]